VSLEQLAQDRMLYPERAPRADGPRDVTDLEGRGPRGNVSSVRISRSFRIFAGLYEERMFALCRDGHEGVLHTRHGAAVGAVMARVAAACS
jgi:hypothetical protein